jgi:dsRNA-specific ribonuclease
MAAAQRTEFETFILHLLDLSGLRYPETYMTSVNMSIFVRAFTAASFDPNFNYEALEQKGDSTVNKSVVDYCYKKLDLINDGGRAVKIISKLKSKYASRQGESELAGALGFWKFVNASSEDKRTNKKKLLEDIFESFVGALEYIIEKTHEVENVGYSVAYRFVTKAIDIVNRNDFLKYQEVIEDAKRRGISKTGALFEEVNDPITKLKEINTSGKYDLDVSYHTLYDEVSIGENEKPIPLKPGDECFYYYKVYIMVNQKKEFNNRRDVDREYDRIFNKVIKKEREFFFKDKEKDKKGKKKNKKYPFFPNYFPVSDRQGKVYAKVREILNENTLGDWDQAIAKLIATEEALEVLRKRGISWKYDEKLFKDPRGTKGDIRKCGSNSPEPDNEDEDKINCI